MSYSYHSGTGSSDTPLVASISNNGNSLRYYYHDDGNIRCMETTCGGKALTYDGAGNLTSYDGTTFTWANGRQLNSVTKADGTTASYTYNHNGQRVTKTVNGVKTEYFYSGGPLMREKSSGLDMKFTYDSVGNVVAVLYNNVEYYYVKNLQGDIIGLIDSAGTWGVSYDYHTWGSLRSMWGTLASTLGTANPFRYRGYYYDAETGMYYLGGCYYSPEICRFISPDRTALLEAEPMKLTSKNLYSYCDDNPVSKMDLHGEIAIPVVAAGAIANSVAYVVSSAIMGEDIELLGIAIAAVSGGIGAVGPKWAVVGAVVDSVYAFITTYEGPDTLGSAILSCMGTFAFSLGSVTGIMSLLEMDEVMPLVEKGMFEAYVGTANNVLVGYAASGTTNTANTGNTQKPKADNNWMKMNVNYNKATFKEKQMGHAIYNPTYNKLTFKERRLRAF